MKTDTSLMGKTIIFLGSSVTYGSAAGGKSFVEDMEQRDGITAVKEAVSGTTLVDEGPDSYIRRMEEKITKDLKADAFVCQLSTNDATLGKRMGEISTSRNREDFDKETVIGAIEYIISYASDTWHCPVIFYTGAYFPSGQYGEMVSALKALSDKWQTGIVNMWEDEAFNAISQELYQEYMADPIHPTRRGYAEWWTPYIENGIARYL